MKEIKDYLHLYLGCDCKTSGGKIGKLVSVGVSGSIIVYDDGEYTNPNGYFISSECLSPILRKVESLTDEEIRDLIQYDKCISEYKIFEYKFYPDKREIYISWSSDENCPCTHWTLNFVQMNGHDFAWCLRKGIDLFGLINDGLAIDKSML